MSAPPAGGLVAGAVTSDKIRSNRRRPMRRLFCLVLLSILAPCALAQTKPATTQPTTRPSGGSGVQAVPPGQLLDSLLKPASSAGPTPRATPRRAAPAAPPRQKHVGPRGAPPQLLR